MSIGGTKVIKKTLGGFKECQTWEEKDQFTNVLFDRESYFRAEGIVNTLEREKGALINKLDSIIKESESMIKGIQKEQKKEMQLLQGKLNNALEQVEQLTHANENLKRIAKERANADRRISPKKKHDGYVLLSMEQATFTNLMRSKKEIYPCWKIRIETPYESGLDYVSVKPMIYEDLTSNGVMKNMGMKRATWNLDDLPFQEVQNTWKKEGNFVFRLIYKLNVSNGFWEVQFWCRDSILIYPGLISPK